MSTPETAGVGQTGIDADACFNPARSVRCPHCRAGVGDPCVSSGKDLRHRRPLVFSSAHPQRIALVAALQAGATQGEARQAARWAVRSDKPWTYTPSCPCDRCEDHRKVIGATCMFGLGPRPEGRQHLNMFEMPYLDVARAAVAEASVATATAYRKAWGDPSRPPRGSQRDDA